MPDSVAQPFVALLRAHLRALGRDFGLMNPSIYDTAQRLRLAPPEDIWPAVDWMIAQQQPDGGWGDPAVPRARDVPTLAAALAIHTYGRRRSDRVSIQEALRFIHRQAEHWQGGLPDDLPVGVELLLPYLLDTAAASSLKIEHGHYAALRALGVRRRLAGRTFPPATRPVHTWESFGSEPHANLVDASGSVGHSPAATAAWLQAAAGRADLADARAAAQRYLEQAEACVGVYGAAPTVWPITRFEQSFALYFVLIAGLLGLPELGDVLQPQLADLARALRPVGLGMSDYFQPDGDDTAAALAVLRAAGWRVPLTALDAFAQDDGLQFCAYPGELQSAISVTTHALHARQLAGLEVRMDGLVERQMPDGRWAGDKWNQSWLYTTSQVLVMLEDDHANSIRQAIRAILDYQHADGGWGIHRSTPEETAYGILALRAGLSHAGEEARAAIARATAWLRQAYQPYSMDIPPIWVGKELYCPRRLVHIVVLSVLIQAEVYPIA
jgi:hypothetical protein